MTDVTNNNLSAENNKHECGCTSIKYVTHIIMACGAFALGAGFFCGQSVAIGICTMGTIVCMTIIIKK